MAKYLWLVIFCSTVMAGCGKEHTIAGKYVVSDKGVYTPEATYTPPGSIDAEMQGYINQFNADAAARGVAVGYSDLVSVSWQDNLNMDGQPLWGYCQIYNEPTGPSKSKIVLSTNLRKALPAIMKVIITHELGHCLLGVEHTTHDPANVLQIMYWSSGVEQANNVANYGNPVTWAKYLDFLFEQKNLEVTL
jgi:hypothetical protein